MDAGLLTVRTLSNGVPVVIEKLEGSRTVAFQLLYGFGSKDDPPGRTGLAAMAESTVLRGSRGWSSRRILDAMDDTGADRDSAAAQEFVSFSATCIPDSLRSLFRLYGVLLASPAFAGREVDRARKQHEAAIVELEDNPGRKVMALACQAALGPYLGRDPLGRRSDLMRITPSVLRDFWRCHAVPGSLHAIVSGAADPQPVLAWLEGSFGRWPNKAPTSSARPPFLPRAVRRAWHGDYEQTHLCLVCPAVPATHPLYYASVVAATVLAGGNSGRLFTEVRDKRGLAYAVSATHRCWRDGVLLVLHTSTSPRRARETLAVCEAELLRLSTVRRSEVDRAKAILRGGLLTGGECPEVRTATLATQMFLTGRPLTLRELVERVEGVTLDQVRESVESFPPSPLTVVSLGRDLPRRVRSAGRRPGTSRPRRSSPGCLGPGRERRLVSS